MLFQRIIFIPLIYYSCAIVDSFDVNLFHFIITLCFYGIEYTQKIYFQNLLKIYVLCQFFT